MFGVFEDFRLATRGLLRSPGFALLAIGSLALGVGANATILGMAKSVLWSELAVAEPDRVVRIFKTDERGTRRLSYSNYREIAEHGNPVLAGITVHRLQTFGIRTDGKPRVVHGELVSSDYFDVLGVEPSAGGLFTATDASFSGAAPVAVISHHLWQDHFSGDPSVVGKVVRLNDHSFQIVGVADGSFHGTKFGLAMDLWVPVWNWADAEEWPSSWLDHGSSSFLGVSRLADGVSLEEAEAGLASTAARLVEVDAEANRNIRLSLYEEIDGAIDPHVAGLPRLVGMLAVLGSGLVLLVACGNVASLLFARAIKRQREVAVRVAIGAGKWRLVRQLLAESVLLALLGAVTGLIIVSFTARSLLSLLPDLPYRFAIDPSPDARVIVICSSVALVSAAVFGLAPALQASAVKPLAALSLGGARSTLRSHRGLSSVVVAIMALSLVSMVMTGLILRSLDQVRRIDPGFDSEGRTIADFDIGLAGDQDLDAVRFAERLVQEARTRPGVVQAAVSSLAPLGDRSEGDQIFANDRAYSEDEAGVDSWRVSVTQGYFDTMGTPLLVGRDFDQRDREDAAPVVIINQKLAESLWPDQSAVGEHIRFTRLSAESSVEVVGVVADGKYNFLNEPQQAAIFRPFAQSPRQQSVLVVRSARASDELLTALPRMIEAVDPRVPVLGVRTLGHHLSSSLWFFRLGATLAAILGFLALALSVGGLYGVTAYAVAQRRFELGIRAAMGATRKGLLSLVVLRGMRLAGLGLVLGMVLALGLGRVMDNVLFGVSGTDPVSFGLGFLILAGLALLASVIPALRAAKLNPVEILRPSD